MPESSKDSPVEASPATELDRLMQRSAELIDNLTAISQRLRDIIEQPMLPPQGPWPISVWAKFLNMDERSVRAMISRNNVPSWQPGKEKFVDRDDLLRNCRRNSDDQEAEEAETSR